MGKGEIARFEQFLLFPQCFQKACFPGASKGFTVWEWVNSLPTNKILDFTKLKAFADDKLNIARMMISPYDKSRKLCGKRRKCWLPAFSPFPTVFSKAFFLKSGWCGKGLMDLML